MESKWLMYSLGKPNKTFGQECVNGNIVVTAVALKVVSGCKSCSADSSNMNVIPGCAPNEVQNSVRQLVC